ncbi:MAG: tetratricopeptide repeat protein [Rhodospirillales bacterium]
MEPNFQSEPEIDLAHPFQALARAAAGRVGHGPQPSTKPRLEPKLARPTAAAKPAGHSAMWRALAAAARPAVLASKPAGHSAMWRALAAAAAAAARPFPVAMPAPAYPGLPGGALGGQAQPRPAQPAAPRPAAPPMPGPRFSLPNLDGLKRLGALGGRIRLSGQGEAKTGARPFRLVLLALITLLAGGLGALYYLGEDAQLLFEALVGEEQVRQPPATPARPSRPIVQQPKDVVEPERPPAPAIEEKPALAAPPVPAPEPAQMAPPSEPIAKPAKPQASAADAALDKVLSEAQRKTVQEKDIADKAASDLPGLLAEVKQRKAQSAAQPQIEVRKATGTPSVAATDKESKIEMVRVRSSSSQSREDAETAYSHLLAGRYEAASLLYAEVLKREPKNLAALTGRAAALHKLGQLGEARGLYEQVLALNPGNREVLSNLMAIYGAEDPRDALRQLENLQRDNPGYSPIPAQMASLLAQTGDVQTAIRYQGLAVQLAPDNILYRFNLAVMQDRAGMAGEAAGSYETVLTMASRSASISLPMPVGQVKERLDYLRTR